MIIAVNSIRDIAQIVCRKDNMSTRSNIAIQLPDGKVKVIYVHSDGYPYGVGKILHDNYNTYDKAEELFNFGDASYLDDKIEGCSFYGRDWDRKIEEATHTEMNIVIWQICEEISILNIYIYSKIIIGLFHAVNISMEKN